jgi:hypothetical protein
MSKKEAVYKLKKLAKSSNEFQDLFYTSKYIQVPESYGYHEPQISIRGQFCSFYNEFIKFLESEKELEYMAGNPEKKKFVENEINKFVLDILLDERYYDSKKLESRIQELLVSIYKPLQKYKIIIPIEYFNTNIFYDFEIEDVTVSRLDLNKLKEDASAANKDYEYHFKSWDKFENYYCISVYESGNNNKLAVERARQKAAKYVDILRLYSYELRFRTFAAKYFSLSESAFVFDSNGKFVLWSNKQNEKKPRYEKLSEEYVREIYSCIRKLEKLSLIEDTKTKSQIDRTIYWIGKAISEPNLDISLILYCTALESLLIPETEGRKAEALALRIALVEKMPDGELSNPFLNYRIYVNRSKVVHGAADRIIKEDDLTHLEWIIPRILYPFIDFAFSNPKIKFTDLIKKLEDFEDVLVIFFHIFLHTGELEDWIDLSEYIMNEKLLEGKYIKITKSGIKKHKEIPYEILYNFFQAAKSNDSGIKLSAVFSLGFLEEKSSVELLSNILLTDDNIEIRKYAALSLGMIKEPTSIGLLIQTLDNKNKVLREASAIALRWIGSPIATESLIKSLADKEPEVRQASAQALGDIRDKRAFQPLIDALEDTDPDVIFSVSIALGKFKNHGAIKYLKMAKKKKTIGTQKAIDWALNEINK